MATGLSRALRCVTSVPRLLVATDFDGVLAPFVLDPMDARPQPGTVETLLAMADSPATTVAVVSGRDLATLDGLTGLAGSQLVRIGSHGAETSHGDAGAITPEIAERLSRLRALVASAVREQDPRIRLEDKPTAVVMHTRGLSEDSAATAGRIAAMAAELDGVDLLSGKGVEELSVLRADKGTAVRALADRAGADAVVYLGDDVTDEHVFRLLTEKDLGIKVGPGQTAAHQRLDDCTEVPVVLTAIAAARS